MVKVLYIDDEPDLCEAFEDAFGDEGIEIRSTDNPSEAPRIVSEFQPQIVFIDYRLGLTTGPEVAKSLPKGPRLVLVTGDLTIEVDPIFERAFKKPFDFDAIEEFLATLQ